MDDTRVLGLDIGDVRIGVALSDPLRILATPLTIIRRTGEAEDIEAVLVLVRRHQVGQIVAGLPLHMNGRPGEQAGKAGDFVAALVRRTDVPVAFRDERLSTVTAERLVRDAGKTGRQTRYDAAAAAVILQGYLDELPR